MSSLREDLAALGPAMFDRLKDIRWSGLTALGGFALGWLGITAFASYRLSYLSPGPLFWFVISLALGILVGSGVSVGRGRLISQAKAAPADAKSSSTTLTKEIRNLIAAVAGGMPWPGWDN